MARKTRAQLKTQSRKVFIVKNGGPAASTITRSSPVIQHLDDLLDSFKLAGEEVVAVSVEELQQLQADGTLAPGQLYQLTDGDATGLLVGFNAADDNLGNAQQGGSFGSYDVATGKFTPGLGGGGGLITLANITEFRDRFNASFTGTVQEFARRLLVKEQFPGYASPSAILPSTVNGYVERGTTIKPTLSPSFNQGDAGALTSYQLRRNNTQLDFDNTPPIQSPAFTDSYLIGIETVTYYARYAYGQGPLKLGDQGNPAPGRISAGTQEPQASVTGVAAAFFGSTASAPSSSSAVRGLGNTVFILGNSLTISLVTGTTNRRFAVAVPSNYTLQTAVDTGNQNANVKPFYTLSTLGVADASGTAQPHNVYLMTVDLPYNPGTTHVLTFTA